MRKKAAKKDRLKNQTIIVTVKQLRLISRSRMDRRETVAKTVPIRQLLKFYTPN